MIVLVDSREPWPHSWQRYLPESWSLERQSLETGDLVLATHPHGVTVERKTPSDMAGCIGADRERFERELRRSRYSGRFVVVIEGSLNDVAVAARGIHHNAVLGTLASWTLRYCPLSSPEAGGWLRNLPGGFWPPSFLRASAAVQAALALNKPGERSRKRRKAQKMNRRFELSIRRIA